MKDSQGTERVPPTWLAHRFAERDGERLVVRGIEEPSAVGLAAALDEVQGIHGARVGLDTGVPEVVERTEDVVVVAGREGELEERRTCDLAGREPSEKSALEQILLAAPAGGREAGHESGRSPARSYSSSPSSTQIVVWNDERVLPGASQFQPPSSSCSLTRRRARVSSGRPNYAPTASTPPLMQGSSSPSKNGFPPGLHPKDPAGTANRRQVPATGIIVPPQAHLETCHRGLDCGVGTVDAGRAQEEHGEQGGQPDGGVGPAPRAVRPLARREFRRRALRAGRGRASAAIAAGEASVQVAHRLPAYGRVGIEKPRDGVHGAILQKFRGSLLRSFSDYSATSKMTSSSIGMPTARVATPHVQISG